MMIKELYLTLTVFLLYAVDSTIARLDLKSALQLQRSQHLLHTVQSVDSEKLIVRQWNRPEFCHKLDCPQFSVTETVKGKYQKRRYISSRWVSTQMSGISYSEAQNAMFMKLFKYISGNNEREEKIEMTAPVLDRLVPGPGPTCESNFTMSFYLSIENPPSPKDKTVFLTELPEMTVYARYFPGYFTKEKKWIDEARELAGFLNGTKFNDKFFYTAGYDSPFKLLGRHNEVWFLE